MEGEATQITLIHSDERGQIWILLIKGKEHTFLVTHQGFARGGCVHPLSNEYAVIIKGRVEYHVKGRKPRIYRTGQSLMIPRNHPHYFVALEDSIILEWGAKPQEKDIRNKEWRRKVDEINEAKRIHV